jgi:hypothetical protein
MCKIGGKISFSGEETPDNPQKKESDAVRLFLKKLFDAKNILMQKSTQPSKSTSLPNIL